MDITEINNRIRAVNGGLSAREVALSEGWVLDLPHLLIKNERSTTLINAGGRRSVHYDAIVVDPATGDLKESSIPDEHIDLDDISPGVGWFWFERVGF